MKIYFTQRITEDDNYDQFVEGLRRFEMTRESADCTCIGEVHMENDPRCEMNLQMKSRTVN